MVPTMQVLASDDPWAPEESHHHLACPLIPNGHRYSVQSSCLLGQSTQLTPMISAFLNWEYKQWITAHSPKMLEQHTTILRSQMQTENKCSYSFQILFPLLKCRRGREEAGLLSYGFFQYWKGFVCLTFHPVGPKWRQWKPWTPICWYLKLNKLLASSPPELYVCYCFLMVICPMLRHAKKPHC